MRQPIQDATTTPGRPTQPIPDNRSGAPDSRPDAPAPKRPDRTWRLQDVLLMAMLGVVFSLVYMGTFKLGLALQTALTPFGFGPFAFEIVYGIWFLAATLAAYIIRKPGVALITEILAGSLELLMGNAGGPMVVLTAVIQGAGAELGFAAFGYRRWDRPALVVSALLTAVFSMFQTLFIGGYAALGIGFVLPMILVRCLSALVFAAFATEGLGNTLAATGVLRSYPLGRIRGPKLDVDDDTL